MSGAGRSGHCRDSRGCGSHLRDAGWRSCGPAEDNVYSPEGFGAEQLAKSNDVNRWKPFVAENYREGRLSVHLHVWGWNCGGDCQDWCLVFERRDPNFHVDLGSGDQSVDGSLQVLSAHGDQGQHPMFVVDVEVIEDSEKLVVGSSVRLKRLDSCPHHVAESFDSVARIREALLAALEQHHEGAMVWRGVRVGLVYGDCIDEVVERGPEVVHEVSEQQPPVCDGGRGPKLDADNVLGGFGIVVNDESVVVQIHEGGGIACESFQVVVCPVELGSNSREEALAKL